MIALLTAHSLVPQLIPRLTAYSVISRLTAHSLVPQLIPRLTAYSVAPQLTAYSVGNIPDLAVRGSEYYQNHTVSRQLR